MTEGFCERTDGGSEVGKKDQDVKEWMNVTIPITTFTFTRPHITLHALPPRCTNFEMLNSPIQHPRLYLSPHRRPFFACISASCSLTFILHSAASIPSPSLPDACNS